MVFRKGSRFLIIGPSVFPHGPKRTPKTTTPIATTTKNIVMCSPNTSLLISVTPTGIFMSNQSADIKKDKG